MKHGNIPYKNIKGTIKSNKKAKTECLYSPWITLSSVNKIGLLKNLSIKKLIKIAIKSAKNINK